MSFGGHQPYGHVPPVQYPVAGQQQQQQQQQQHGQDQPAAYNPARRPSFSAGTDDAAYFDSGAGGHRAPAYHGSVVGRGSVGDDELFLSSPTDNSGGRASTGTSHAVGGGYNPQQTPALSGYQHQYQAQTPPTPSTYNPQAFARSPSTSLPYHPHQPLTRYGTVSGATGYTPAAVTNYTPAPYNPAAYSATNTTLPQRHGTYSGYNSYAAHQQHTYSTATVSQVSTTYTPSAYATSHAEMSATHTATQASTHEHTYQSSQYSPSQTTSQASSQSAATVTSYAAYGSGYSSGYQPAAYQSNGSSQAVSSGYSAASTAAPYPSQSQIPVGPGYSYGDSSYVNRPGRSNSASSSAPSPVQATGLGLQRHPTNAPLPSRPIESVPEHEVWSGRQRQDSLSQGFGTQDDIIHDIEERLHINDGPPRPANGEVSDEDYDPRYTTASPTVHDNSSVARYSSNASTLNRNAAPTTYAYVDEDEESDPEGAAGLLAMQQADLEDQRRSSAGASVFRPYITQPVAPTLPTPAEEQSSDSDYGGMMDLGLFSGGYAANMSYGNDVGTTHVEHDSRPLPQPGSSTAYPNYNDETAFPAFTDAGVDYSGTGGLQAPTAHRLSFDEGEERVSVHSRHSGSDSPYKDDYPDMFYHPGLSNRPLPALPLMTDASSAQSPSNLRGHSYSLSSESRPANAVAAASYHYQHPETPASYHVDVTSQQHVDRSHSLSAHTTTPTVPTLPRSRTDAAEERRRMARHMTQQQQQAAAQGLPFDGYDTGTPSSMAYDLITIPTGRRRKFQANKLTPQDLAACREPWALGGIADWVRAMAEGEQDLKQKAIEECLVRLFTFKVPTMNVADAEALSASVVASMFKEGMLLPDEEWVKFGPGTVSGVLWQLTGSGCYAPRVHDPETAGRCYSHHCTRTLKKANLDELMPEESKKEDWVTYYKITKEMIETKPKKEIERQNVLHEIVTGEEDYMNQLDVLRVLYKEQLLKWQPPIIAPNRLEKFVNQVFGKVEVLQATNRDNLLAQLKYRQKEQGPWIVGFSDLFREWIRKARQIYIEYAHSYPFSVYMVRKEADRNVLFRQFLEQVRNHKRSDKLDWSTFLKAPITRLQRYTLLLGVVLKNMPGESEEKSNLARAIEEIRSVTLECDAKVDEMQKKVAMIELDSMLVLRPEFHQALNLDHWGRELILKGDLQRMGSKGVRWVDTHAILFDHYFILAKVVYTKDGRNEKKYDVSKEPIPMPLLFLESTNDDPISKQKGITAPLTRTTVVTSASETKLNKVTSNGPERPGLEHTATTSSLGSAVTKLASTPSAADAEGKILYPFKIKHLGHEVYTLYATTPQSRSEWCNKIIEAKTRHAKALFAQNAEPFKLRVMADYSFGYDQASPMGRLDGVVVRGTPLDRAIRDMERIYGPGKGQAPASAVPTYRTQVNCATSFTAYGKSITAIGTDIGIFISETSNPRGWTKSVTATRVTQMAVLEEFSVCLVIADRSLISYPLDAIAPPSSFPAPAHDNPRRAPQRLAKDVSFFATARMKDRMLIFFKLKEGMHNRFKVLEPVFQRSTERKRGLFKGKSSAGTTESFRDFDEFYLPVECYSLNLFQTYIAVSTAKGFELLTLDKKQTMSIPDLKQPSIASIASRIRDQRPLGMFRLNDQEFLLTYEDCAVYVDKHGDVSRTLIMEYSGKAKKARAATMFGQYLVLFNEDCVEVRNAENGRLRQIIAGRDVRCLDLGVRGPTGGTNVGGAANAHPHHWYHSGGAQAAGALPGQHHSTPPPYMMGASHDSKGTVKIAMSHPEVPGMQIVLEMLLNDGHTETT